MPHILRKVFPVLSLSIFSATLGLGIIAPLLPLYAEGLGATSIWLGIIFASFSVSRAVVIPIAGKVSDRRGRKRFLAIGLLAYTVISFGYMWAGNVAGLTLVRLLHGVASGMVMPIAQAYVGDVVPEGEEGKWMGYFNSAFFAGVGCGPLLGGILAEHLGMNAAFYTMGGLSLLAFLGVVLFLPEISTRQKAIGPSSSFKEIATSGTVRGLFSFRVGIASARGILMTFLPVFAGMYLGLSLSLIGVLLAVQILGSSLLQIPSGSIADRLNRRGLVVLGCFIYLTAVALVPSTTNFWSLFALSVMVSLGDAAALPAASAMTIQEGKKYGMGMAMAMFNMAFSIGMALGPFLAGILADLSNSSYVFYFAAAIMVAGVSLFSWFTR